MHMFIAGASFTRNGTAAMVDGGRVTDVCSQERVTRVRSAGVNARGLLDQAHEPIVCNPRDAVRVFYGTGLDALVNQFVLRR